MEIFPPVGGAPLAKQEGLLIIQIDTDVPLQWISFENARVAENVPKGRHIWVVRARAGDYAWNEIGIGAEVGREQTIEFDDYRALKKRKDWVWDDEYEFDVEAAKINYPGELIIQRYAPGQGAGRGFWIRNRNHSAMAIRELQKTHAALLGMYPVRHAGAGHDGFLEYYSRERDRMDTETGSGAP